jgi:hypothetical protein
MISTVGGISNNHKPFVSLLLPHLKSQILTCGHNPPLREGGGGRFLSTFWLKQFLGLLLRIHCLPTISSGFATLSQDIRATSQKSQNHDSSWKLMRLLHAALQQLRSKLFVGQCGQRGHIDVNLRNSFRNVRQQNCRGDRLRIATL